MTSLNVSGPALRCIMAVGDAVMNKESERV
jgi:hypothetical protein